MEYRMALKAARCLRPQKARLNKGGEIRIGTMCPITYVGHALTQESRDPNDYEQSSQALRLSFQAFGLETADEFVQAVDYTVAELRHHDSAYLIPARRKLLKLFGLKEHR